MTALSVAACGSSKTSSPTTSPSTAAASPTTTSSAPAPANGETRISGLIASVAGNAAQVTRQNGNVTVNFTESTKVTEVTRAALTDVAAGSCVSVRPQVEGQRGQPITAASVGVSTAVDGKCPQGSQSAPGSTPPAPSGPPTTAPAKRSAVQGAVASVTGNTINVTTTDASGNATQTPVTVNDKTKYTKQTAANTQAISAGKCMTAKGTRDGGGALQATTIDLRPAHDGKCAGEAWPHGHRG